MENCLTKVANKTTIAPPKESVLSGVVATSNKPERYKRNLETTQKDFIDAFVVNVGLIYKSCEQAGIRWSTYRGWLKQDKFKLKFEEAQQRVNEIVEQSLLSKFKTNSPVPEIFYLKSRDARYKQIAVLEGNEEKPIVVTHDAKTLEKISQKIMEAMKAE